MNSRKRCAVSNVMFFVISCVLIWLGLEVKSLKAVWNGERQWALVGRIVDFVDTNERMPFDEVELNLWIHDSTDVKLPAGIRFATNISLDEIIDCGKSSILGDELVVDLNNQIRRSLIRRRRNGFMPMLSENEKLIYERLPSSSLARDRTTDEDDNEMVRVVDAFLRCNPLPSDYIEKMYRVFLNNKASDELRFSALRNLGVACIRELRNIRDCSEIELLSTVARDRKSAFAGIALYATVRIQWKLRRVSSDYLTAMLSEIIMDASAHRNCRLAAVYLSGELKLTALTPLLSDLSAGADETFAISIRSVLDHLKHVPPPSYGNNCQEPIACDFARPLSALPCLFSSLTPFCR